MATSRDIGVRWRFDSFEVVDAAALSQDLSFDGLADEAEQLLKCNSVLLSRGRTPSRGCVVMRKSEYLRIQNPHSCIHTLTVNAEVPLQVRRLCVTKVTALVPGFKPGDDVPETTDETFLIVEFADARNYAGAFSAIDAQFNAREATGDAFTSTGDGDGKFTYQGLAEEIWKDLSSLFGANLSFHVDDVEPELSPENMKFFGVSAWDALWVVFDLAGWTLFLDDKGDPQVIQFGDPVDDDEFNRLISTATRRELADADNILAGFLPETIEVTTTQRNYQFDVNEDTFTAGDNYRRFPTRTESFQTRALLPNPNKAIAANTTRQLWSGLQLFINDAGFTANGDLVQEHSQNIAERYLRFQDEGKATEFEWIGLQPFRPSKLFSGVLFISHGTFRTVGLNSRVAEPEWVDGRIEWQLSWKGEEARHGALTLDAVPHGRELYAILRNRFPAGSPGEEINNVQTDRWGIVDILQGNALAAGVSWFTVGSAIAVNATGGPVRLNRRVFCKWNYQLGTGGHWAIVAVHGPPVDSDLADWEARCVTDGTPVARLDDPGLVVVNRRSMLRLIRPRTTTEASAAAASSGDLPQHLQELNPIPQRDTLPPHLRQLVEGDEPEGELPDARQDIQEVDRDIEAIIVDVQHGPPNTLLWTGSGQSGANEDTTEANTIYWTNGPTVSTMRLSSGILSLGDGTRVSQIIEPSSGAIRLRLPPTPGRSDRFLISSSVSGDCVETDWFGPGVDCTIKVATECFNPGSFFDDYFCQMVDNCNEFGNPWGSTGLPEDLLGSPSGTDCDVRQYEFQKGLLTSGQGCSQAGSSGGGATCPDVQIRHFNPCRDVDDEPISPGEDPVEPEEPTPGFNPDPPDPGDELPPLLGDPTVPVVDGVPQVDLSDGFGIQRLIARIFRRTS